MALLLVLLAAGAGHGAAAPPVAGALLTSQAGLYRVSYSSRLNPIVINRMHSGVLHVQAANGDPVEGAAITVQGGMPEHDHGLPTSPRVIEELGGGDYVIGGLRFHMNGYWELTFEISAAGRRDSVIVPLVL